MVVRTGLGVGMLKLKIVQLIYDNISALFSYHASFSPHLMFVNSKMPSAVKFGNNLLSKMRPFVSVRWGWIKLLVFLYLNKL
jgi:hypothetical protein